MHVELELVSILGEDVLKLLLLRHGGAVALEHMIAPDAKDMLLAKHVLVWL